MEARSANSYDFVRFCAASAVLFSHHFVISGFSEPPVPGYGEDFGKLGVEVFFCLSGFLICRSLQRDNDWLRFVLARVLRIFPNLAFALVVTSAFTLVWYGNYQNFWAHVKYVVHNLSMFVVGVSYAIPGVFTDARGTVVNGPLWSLPLELWLYVLLFALVVAGNRRSGFNGLWIVCAGLAASIFWTAGPFLRDLTIGPFDSFQLSRLGSFFLSGAALAVIWPAIARYAVAIGVAALIGVLAVRKAVPFDTVLHSLALAAAVIGLGASKAMAWFSRGGDASYGIYIFAWPVQKFSLLLIGSFWPSMLIAFLITTAIGYTTWHVFERRLMACRHALAQWLRAMASGPALAMPRPAPGPAD